ncbi:MAG: HTTM domain-containing protein [Cytophagaceae bacterium]
MVILQNYSSRLTNALVSYFSKTFYLDLRSISALRIGIGCVLLADIIIRSTDLRTNYTMEGLLPAEALFRYAWSIYSFSFYTISDNFYIQSIIFMINAACILCLIFGYRTRLFTILCWLFLLSLHNRNPLILQGGDDFLRMILFWGIFMPWGARYSIDSLNSHGSDSVFVSPVGLAYVTQIMFLYVFSALLKSSPEWTTEFTALYYALSLDQIAYYPGKFLLNFPTLMKMLTAGVYFLELYIPFILLLPMKNQKFRNIFFVLIVLLHIGIGLTMNVGLFPIISTVSMIGLLPGNLIQTVADKIYSITNLVKYIPSVFKRSAGSHKKVTEPILVSVLILLLFVYSVSNNFHSVGRPNVISASFGPVGECVRINQFWGMFAPCVLKDDGWFIYLGETESCKEVDLYLNKDSVTYEKPDYIAGTFKNDRWRKYHENLLFRDNDIFRHYYCSYLMRRWNNSHEDKLTNLKIIYMKEFTLPDYQESVPVKEVLCECW